MRPGSSVGPSFPSSAASLADRLSTDNRASANHTSANHTAAKPKSATGAIPEASLDEYVWPLGVVAGVPPEPVGKSTRSAGEPRDPCEVAPASAGDHPAIQQLLSAVFHAPSREEFSASLEDPLYEPCDRIVLKRGPQLLGHVHLAQRAMRFQGESLPVSALHRLAVLPEFRNRGYGLRLLSQVDAAMKAEGSVLGLLTTRAPHFFRRKDWVVCMRHSHAVVGARDLLAQLSARGFAPHGADDTINIRPWRHVELPSLVRLYAEETAAAFGPYERTEAYWRWLVGRQAAENIFVALAGPKRFDFDFHDDSIVGYVIQRDDRIVELVASAQHPGTAERLLARACGESIERDHHVVRLHLAPSDPLWRIVEGAEGELHRSEASQGEVTMVKLLDPEGFLHRLLPTLHDRAAAAQQAGRLRRPLELGIVVGEHRLRLSISQRSAKVSRGAPGRSWIQLSKADFTRMLLGHLDLAEAADAGRVKSSTRPTLEAAAALFPRLPLWHPPLDDMLV